MTNIEPGTSPSPVARAARTSLAALLATAVWMVIAFGLVRNQGCEGGMECLGDALLTIFGCLLAAAVSMWPLLVLFRVRPAWPIALVGPVLFVCLTVVVVRSELAARTPWTWVLAIELAYVGAAILVDRRVNRVVRVAILVLALAAFVSRVF
ncbi:hypothetical protein QEZ54_15775 [Catellatospora sp. KI3]|uniref:hypothetical protein n=1 Tax=Catellatospora sp. KI3 TaxID=3041620 RepID=UPI0024826A4D|nr:hypothetical protein [Catellatospora sp. KI3]MDI1462430.1 hypothetical protein [Catellatospora sp. KI3]